MARITAPSLWLPGFSPDIPTLSPLDTEPEFQSLLPALAVPDDIDLTESAGNAADEESTEFNPASPVPTSWRVGAATSKPRSPCLWPLLTRNHLVRPGGAVAKFGFNLAAIDTLRRIEAEQRPATSAERGILLRYTGRGGLPASFNLEASDGAWLERARRLRAVLANEDYEAARASVSNSHYTEVHVVEAMWQAAERFGFSGGRILEPAAGIGHFIGAMPQDLAENSQVTAIEIDRLSGRMLTTLYAPGGVDVRVAPFEKTPLPDNWFDLVIGNVPFGRYKVADLSNRAYARFSIHNYFFGRASVR